MADKDLLSQEMVKERWPNTQPAIQDYFISLYPPDFWKEATKEATAAHHEHDEQVSQLKKFALTQWKTDGVKPAQLNATTDNGRAVAELIADGLRREFLAFASKKIALPK